MDKNNDQDKNNQENHENKQSESDVDLIPGGRIYQYFTKQRHRMLTPNLNRMAMLIIVLALLLTISKSIAIGTGQSIYCLECRSCLAVGDDCPADLQPSELVIAARTGDYKNFIKDGGLECITCGECVEYCIVDIDIASVIGTMQDRTMDAIKAGRIPNNLLVEALEEDRIGAEYVEEVEEYLLEQGVDVK
ncbi:hypothetical protein [Natranaerofaba carboxydovora]|uniref:hypothetical protein n=1 Tax=Natranaerofaba carboxydovora TaxID=2742683 RepID=UPI001F1440B5|nr:hypothetical protein [Natranaerofaba carboxydovora]UMZ74094.1 rnfC: electron transport complex, RnfABCDGE type, C subunit [Natranaerofaba carboxydovora]